MELRPSVDRLLKISVQWSIAIKKANRNSYEKESTTQQYALHQFKVLLHYKYWI